MVLLAAAIAVVWLSAGTPGHDAIGQIPTVPPDGRAGIPGSAVLPPNQRVTFSTAGNLSSEAATPPPGSPSGVEVSNFSDQMATVATVFDDQGLSVSISVGDSYTVVRLPASVSEAPGGCFKAEGRTNVVRCPVSGPSNRNAQLSFTAIRAGAPPDTSASLLAGTSATLTKPFSGLTPPPPVPDPSVVYIGVNVVTVSRLAAVAGSESPQPASIDWNGSDLLITAPPAFFIHPFLPANRCSPASGLPNTVACSVVYPGGVVIQFSVEDHQLPAEVQTVPAPGSAEVTPAGVVHFVFPLQPGSSIDDRHQIINVRSVGERSALVAVNAIGLTIRAPEGFLLLPDAVCTPAVDKPSTVTCADPPTHTVMFALADTAAAQPLPQESAVAAGATAVFVAPAEDGGLNPTLGVSCDAAAFASCAGLDAEWAGESLTVTTRDGFAVSEAYGQSGGCVAQDGQSTVLVCPASGLPARLLHFTTTLLNPSRLPPGTPPFPLSAEIASPPSGGKTVQAIGQPVTFSASGPVQGPFAWDFGDGMLAIGQTAQHTYTGAGIYTATLIYFPGGVLNPASIDEKHVLVPVGVQPVQVTYPASWNLVGGPQGTDFSGAQGPLYYLPFPPICHAVNNLATPAVVETPGTGTAVQLPPGCTNEYATAPAGAVGSFGCGVNVDCRAAGQGYWAFFPRPTTVTIPFTLPGTGSRFLPGDRWIMVADPSYLPVRVTGADAVYTYDPATGKYAPTTMLQPGQGAWAYAVLTGEISFTPESR